MQTAMFPDNSFGGEMGSMDGMSGMGAPQQQQGTRDFAV